MEAGDASADPPAAVRLNEAIDSGIEAEIFCDSRMVWRVVLVDPPRPERSIALDEELSSAARHPDAELWRPVAHSAGHSVARIRRALASAVGRGLFVDVSLLCRRFGPDDPQQPSVF